MPLDLSSLTLGELREMNRLFPSGPNLAASESAFVIGTSYLIRTPTVYHLGRLVRITPTELVLDEAGWLVDTGRFGECISKGTYNEFEPMGDGIIVPRINISDATIWKHKLPKEAK